MPENPAVVDATRVPTERLTLENVAEAFQYQPWDSSQQLVGDAVRQRLQAAAEAILFGVPESPMRTRALNAIVDARMLANAAITFRGKF